MSRTKEPVYISVPWEGMFKPIKGIIGPDMKKPKLSLYDIGVAYFLAEEFDRVPDITKLETASKLMGPINEDILKSLCGMRRDEVAALLATAVTKNMNNLE